MINYGAAWERYSELADRKTVTDRDVDGTICYTDKEDLTFDEIVAVVNAARPTVEDDLTAQLEAMTETEQRYALYFLWGTMRVADPQRCRDALTAAAGW